MDELLELLAALPAATRHHLACDCLERALLILGPEEAPEPWAAIAVTRRWLDGGCDDAELQRHGSRLWDLIPGRGTYPNVSLEPRRETLPAWTAAELADPRRIDLDDVLDKVPLIAASGALRAAKRAVLDAARASATVPRPAEIARAAAIAATHAVGERLRDPDADAHRDRLLRAATLPPADWYDGLDHAVIAAETQWIERFVRARRLV